MKIKLLIITLLCSVIGWSQVTIVSDGLNNATTLFTLTNGAYFTGNSVVGDRPASSPFAFEGSHSRGVINASATLLSNDINTSGYNTITMSFKLASFSIGSTGNGADGGDIVTIEVSPNGGTNWYSTERILGNANAYWAYSATGIATTAYDGNATPVDFTPAGGGSRTTDGYSNIEITNLPSTTNLKFRITLLNNATAEQWIIDDFKVQGILASSNTITTNTSITGSPFCVTASTGASVSVPFTSVGTFTGNTYTAQLSSAAGSFVAPVSIGTLVSDLNSGTITATIPAGTAAGVGYRIRVVSNSPVVNGTDNTVNLVVQNGAAISAQPSTTAQNLCQSVGASALSVTASGSTLTYQWYSNAANSNSGGTPVGTNSNTYTPSTAAAGTLYYYCEVTAACGSLVKSNVSGAVNVTAIPGAPSGTINVSANPSCGAATLSYSAPSATIYWQTSAGGTSVANQTTSNYISSATAGPYTIYVRELNGTCWSPAISVTFTVVAPVAISVQPPNRVITDGANTTFTVTATGTTPTYQWQVDTGSGFVNLTNVAPYTNVTTNALSITGVPITFNGYLYRCVVSGAAPCGSVTSNSGSLTVSLTAPNNPTTVVPCYGNNTLGLSWTASTSGATPAPDGYMVFALAGATTPAATSAVAGNANLYTANLDFSLASVVTASLGKCLYKGTGTSFTVSGLTNLSNYSFKVVAYRGTTGTAWSTGINTNGTWNTPTTNITIDMPEVTALAASVASGQSGLTWTRPTPLSCYDEYLVVANQGAVVFTPTGDGTAYTPNTVYSGSNQVVYNGTGTGVTVTGLTNGLSYCYKVFVRRGTEWSDGVSVCQTPNLVYCASGATSNLDSEIENVTLVGYSTTISNNTANVCTTGVNNYTAMSADLQVGGTYTLEVEFGDCSGGNQFDGAGGVWIDWNNDGDFLDANETIGTTDIAMSVTDTNVIQNFNINVPGGQPIGNYRMRIVQTEAGTSGTVSPCGTFTYGSTEDYTVQVINACVPTHSVTSFTPTSGPVGTEITIIGTSLTGTTVTFSGVNATIVSNNGTQLVVLVPTGAITGNMKVIDAQPCEITNAFTVISKNNSSCEGAITSDLIIYDIHDEKTGSGGFITLYNGTASIVDLTNYTIWRTTLHDDGNEVDYATLTGTIAPGALGILKVSPASCGPASTNGTIDGGFNDNDGIQLRNAAGTVIIDDVDTYSTAPGYYMVRNTGALSARTSYVAADWNTIPLVSGECYPSAGLNLPTSGAPPVVTSHPTYSPSCGSTSAILNTNGTEGFAGGLSLAFQWYFAAPGSATWTIVSDGGIYSGATTANLSISDVTGVVNYQYYCQIRENSAMCFSATNAVKITDSNATTWNGTTWSNGTPTLTKAAIIDGTYTTATHGNFSCCSLTVNATRTLTISTGGYVEVQNNVSNSGTLTVLNSGSLVQINDAGVNTGNIQYQRIANIRKQDYVYWSSPVIGFASNAVSPGTSLGYQYKWLPTTAGINNFGNWTNANETMVLGKGYGLRGPDSFSISAFANYTAIFNGIPNNGVITIPISRGNWNGGTYNTLVSTTLGTNEDDNWNLVGNPYPSAIHAIDFLTLNTNIDGFVNIWTHGALPSNATVDPFYNDYAYNYTATDYITYNASGNSSGAGVFNGLIAGGQGFFVSMLHTTGATTENLTFNNSLRNRTHNNGQFFRNANVATSSDNIERNRIWLDLVSSSGTSVRSMFGYIENATNGKDRLFDAFSNQKLSFNIFSLIDEEQMLIQGKSLPFDTNDKVNIGVAIPQDGLYKIAISSVDGLFTDVNQKIYLEDKLLNVIYDLRTAPYSFMANKGVIKNRFVIRFNNEVVLANDTFNNNNDVVVVSNQELSVESIKEEIENITIYDVLGRKLFETKGVNKNAFIISIDKRDAPLFIEIDLVNGAKIIKKTVF